jgi:hypothetical protein
MPGLDAQQLVVGHLWRPDVPRAGDVLAIALEALLIESLVVDSELLLDGHVIERGHALRANDGETPLLMGIEP